MSWWRLLSKIKPFCADCRKSNQLTPLQIGLTTSKNSRESETTCVSIVTSSTNAIPEVDSPSQLLKLTTWRDSTLYQESVLASPVQEVLLPSKATTLCIRAILVLDSEDMEPVERPLVHRDLSPLLDRLRIWTRIESCCTKEASNLVKATI